MAASDKLFSSGGQTCPGLYLKIYIIIKLNEFIVCVSYLTPLTRIFLGPSSMAEFLVSISKPLFEIPYAPTISDC